MTGELSAVGLACQVLVATREEAGKNGPAAKKPRRRTTTVRGLSVAPGQPALAGSVMLLQLSAQLRNVGVIGDLLWCEHASVSSL
ncbi:hypothetical protein [Streptomyces cavourensis]|uniref:hypothetical protein n=1 Tax=Streptomyces cavourensis TaxID=67258 RepID=UPI000DC6579B|nr:hypothetical protein [Streptomyces cavourensis]ATY94023.1 hypothetical protein CVT27_00030 [Streptomyces cavourensis]